MTKSMKVEESVVLHKIIENLKEKNKQLKEEQQVLQLGVETMSGLVGQYANEIECLKEIISQLQSELKKEKDIKSKAVDYLKREVANQLE